MNPASKLNSKYAFKITGLVTELMMGLGSKGKTKILKCLANNDWV